MFYIRPTHRREIYALNKSSIHPLQIQLYNEQYYFLSITSSTQALISTAYYYNRHITSLIRRQGLKNSNGSD